MLSHAATLLVSIPDILKVGEQLGLIRENVKIKNAKAMDSTQTIVKSDEEWRKVLTPEQYEVLREKGTDRPF